MDLRTNDFREWRLVDAVGKVCRGRNSSEGRHKHQSCSQLSFGLA